MIAARQPTNSARRRCPSLRVERRQLASLAEPLAIRRIADHEPAARFGRPCRCATSCRASCTKPASPAACALRLPRSARADRRRNRKTPAAACAGPASARCLRRFDERRPERGVVPAPAEKTEVVALQVPARHRPPSARLRSAASPSRTSDRRARRRSRTPRGQPPRSSIAAARFSFSGASPCPRRQPRRCSGVPDRSSDTVATSRCRRRLMRIDGRSRSTPGRAPMRIAKLIDDRILDALRDELRMRERARRRRPRRPRACRRHRDAATSRSAARRRTARRHQPRRTRRAASGCGWRAAIRGTRDSRFEIARERDAGELLVHVAGAERRSSSRRRYSSPFAQVAK